MRNSNTALEQDDTEREPTQRERDAQLVEAARGGDARAKQALLRRHRPGVVAIARRYVRPQLRLEDLVQEGYVGLLAALDGFDPERGVTFWTYAHYWVAYRVQRHAFENRRIVRPPRTRVSRRIRGSIRRVRAELEEALGRAPDRAELASAMGVDESELASHEASAGGDVHLEQRQDPDLPSPTANPEELSAGLEAHRHRSRALRKALESLDDREATIVERRFFDADGESYASLGREFGVSRERVRQLSVRALGKIRANLDDGAELLAACAS